MRIVLDTNCLIQILPQRSPYHLVWQSFENGDNTLCVTNEIIEEYTEILQRLIDEETAEIVVSTILNSPFVVFADPYFKFNLITSDPDDNKFVDCAIAAGAKYIVTNDRHYNILHVIEYPKVDVVSLDAFVKMMQL